MAKKDELMEQLIRETLKDRVKEEVAKRMEEFDFEKVFRQVLTPELVKKQFIEYTNSEFVTYFDDNFFHNLINSDIQFYKAKMNSILKRLLEDPQVIKCVNETIKKEYLNDISNYCVVDDLITNILSEFEIKLVPKEKVNRKSNGNKQK